MDMKLLVLPSRRLLLFQNTAIKFIPIQCEEIRTCGSFIAHHHYKTFSVYEKQSFLKNKPIFTEVFPKKLQTFDICAKQNFTECLISDKFGDMFRMIIPHQKANVEPKPIYMNSNLGIPKYIKHIQHQGKEYLIEGDEQNRIKVFNSANPHQIISIWHLINMYSIECIVMDNNFVFLLKYYDKSNLEQNIFLHTFKVSQIQSQEYPGTEIPIQYKFNNKKCKFYTMIKFSQKIILILLEQARICLQIFQQNQKSFQKYGQSIQIPIKEGKWDYVNAIQGDNSELLITFGSQVQVSADIPKQEWENEKQIQFNQYEYFCRVKIPE